MDLLLVSIHLTKFGLRLNNAYFTGSLLVDPFSGSLMISAYLHFGSNDSYYVRRYPISCDIVQHNRVYTYSFEGMSHS